MRIVLQDEHKAACPVRIQLAAAFDLIESAGERFWGQFGLWTRRRGAADSFLAYHHGSFLAELAAEA